IAGARHHEGVGAAAAVQDVVAGAAGQGIVVGAAGQGVVAGIAAQVAGPGVGAGDGVVASTAVDEGEVGDRRQMAEIEDLVGGCARDAGADVAVPGLNRIRPGIEARQRHGIERVEDVGTGAAIEGVALAVLAADNEGVVAVVAEQVVVAGTAGDDVVAVATMDGVVAGAAVDGIGAGQTIDDVIAAQRVDGVVAVGRKRLTRRRVGVVNGVVLGGAGDGHAGQVDGDVE